MKLKIAKIEDIEGVLQLQYKYHTDSIPEQDRKDGFVTTSFSEEQLTNLILQENGLFVAFNHGEIVAYLMAASWGFWSSWPLFEFMIKELPKLHYLGQTLDMDNSYQYGPVCIDKSVRGSGVLEQLFDFSLREMSKKFPVLVTFVNKNNPRSYAAHTRKLGLLVIHEFEFKGNAYYEMVCDTSRKV